MPFLARRRWIPIAFFAVLAGAPWRRVRAGADAGSARVQRGDGQGARRRLRRDDARPRELRPRREPGEARAGYGRRGVRGRGPRRQDREGARKDRGLLRGEVRRERQPAAGLAEAAAVRCHGRRRRERGGRGRRPRALPRPPRRGDRSRRSARDRRQGRRAVPAARRARGGRVPRGASPRVRPLQEGGSEARGRAVRRCRGSRGMLRRRSKGSDRQALHASEAEAKLRSKCEAKGVDLGARCRRAARATPQPTRACAEPRGRVPRVPDRRGGGRRSSSTATSRTTARRTRAAP